MSGVFSPSETGTRSHPWQPKCQRWVTPFSPRAPSEPRGSPRAWLARRSSSGLAPGCRALLVALPGGLAYWTVCDGGYRPVADLYLRGLRLIRSGPRRGHDAGLRRQPGVLFRLVPGGGRSLLQAAERLELFVLHLRTTPVSRRGSGHGRTRSPERINHILGAVREMYKEAVARRLLPGSALAARYAVGDDRHLPAELRRDGAGLRYVARPRHRLRAPRSAETPALGAGEWEALLRACGSWRDRLLLILLDSCGLRRGEALGLRRCDLHLAPSSAALGCRVEGPHVHVIPQENVNGAGAKSGRARTVPAHPHVVAAYDRYLEEREACAAAADCDFVFVNLFRSPLGRRWRSGAPTSSWPRSRAGPALSGPPGRIFCATPWRRTCARRTWRSRWSRS
jgi:integrase/recombinase XerD